MPKFTYPGSALTTSSHRATASPLISSIHRHHATVGPGRREKKTVSWTKNAELKFYFVDGEPSGLTTKTRRVPIREHEKKSKYRIRKIKKSKPNQKGTPPPEKVDEPMKKQLSTMAGKRLPCIAP